LEIKGVKMTNKIKEPYYFFEEVDGKEVCRNMCLIETYKLKDGRTVNICMLSEKVDLEKDPILKELFEKMR
jgi:hypothetical protein